MKLRNKNTGGIAEIKLKLNEILPDAIRRTIKESGWEDVAEPLIKDEKIRKAVRAWAEANDIKQVWHECSSCWLRGNGLTIELENEVDELEQGSYTIAELCGEEEECESMTSIK